MKILRCVRTYDPARGGVAEAIDGFASAAASNGVQTEVLSLDPPEVPWLDARQAKTHTMGGAARGTYGWCKSYGQWLESHVQDYDVVILDGIWTYASFGAARVLRRAGKPYYVFTHGMLDPWFKVTYPLKHLKKIPYWWLAEYSVLRRAQGVFFTCQEERNLARQSFRHYDCRELVLGFGINDPVTNGTTAGRPPALASVGERFLLFLGRLCEKKACLELVRAFKAFRRETNGPPLDLVLAGPPDNDAYQRQLLYEGADDPHIHFLPAIFGEDKWRLMAAAEALICPSHQENFGIVVAEALALSKPVLISDKVNIWREIDVDHAGIVAPDTAAGIRELLVRWSALSTSAKSAMSANARACYEKNFMMKEYVKRLLTFLQTDLDLASSAR